MINLSSIITKLSQIFAKIEKNKKNVEYMPTGFPKIDAALDGGFYKKELIVIGAFTGVGKSYIAGQIFHTMVINGFTSAYFSLEMSKETVASRLVGSIANIKPIRIIRGELTPEEHEKKVTAKAKLNVFDDYMDFYDDLYELADIETVIKNHKYDFIVIDFVQNIFTQGRDEYARLAVISLALQRIAKQQNCCILVLSQVSNAAAKELNKRNQSPVFEYKGSGNIAHVCDLGFFLTRAEFVEKKDREYDTIYLILKKNRRGPAGDKFELKFRQPGGEIYE